MNTPNLITLCRILMIPFFLVFMQRADKTSLIIALLLFLVASLTDFLDGYLARKLNQVTTFGKLIDPLADKLLITAALLSFVELQLIQAWVVFIILGREFAVTGLRTLLAGEGTIVAADISGKIKTVLQIILVIVFLAKMIWGVNKILLNVVLIFTVALTVYSGCKYFWLNRKKISFK